MCDPNARPHQPSNLNGHWQCQECGAWNDPVHDEGDCYWCNVADIWEKENVSECDCCGRPAVLSRCIAYGIEIYACDDCRGVVDL
jgi:hypothetical protein